MGERTSYTHGTFSWVENVTTDQEGAKAFYAAVLGWDYEDTPAGDGIYYTMAKLHGKRVAAIAPQQQDEIAQGIPPHWNNYVTVDDVDAISARVDELGGNLAVPPFDVMESVGRMAVLIDSVGAPLSLWQPKDNIGAELVNAPGAFCWNDLGTSDPEAAQRFYGELFGWAFEDVGAPGVRYWTIKNGDSTNGSIHEGPADVPSFWMPYFAVNDIDAATVTIEAHGGSQQVPKTSTVGVNAISVYTDQGGAWFGLFEGDLDD